MATTYDITTKRGASWPGFTIEFLLDDTAVDLTGASIKIDVKKDPCDSTPVFSFSTDEESILIGDPTAGIFSIQPQIIDVVPRVYYYDCRVEQSNGRVDYILEGRFEIEQTVTREA